MESKVYNQEGKEVGTIKLPKSVFGVTWNGNLVHEVTISMASNKRNSTAHAKDRSDVSGGGKKPWRQKGTGRARHGSSRSPIWVGGGVTHGPTNEKNYYKKINKKKKAKALYTVLSQKLKDNEILFIDSFNMKDPKTAEAKKILSNLSSIPGFESVLTKRKNSAVLSLDKRDEVVEKSFRNFGNLTLGEVKDINPLLLLQNKYLVIVNPEESLKKIEGKI